MSKRPFITQDCSPNIIIVPTVSFCEPPPKKPRVESQTKETCEQAPVLWNPEYSSKSISNNSVQSESSDNKNGDSRQSKQSVNTMERPSPSWAGNYLMSIGDSHNPVKLNLSSSRKKIEVLTENSSENETVQLTALPVLNKISINERKGQGRYKDILTSKLYLGNSSKTEDTYDETKVKSFKTLCRFDETETTMKNPNTSSGFKSVCKQHLNRETESDKEYKIKIITPSSSNFTAHDKYKFIKKYDQNTSNTGSEKKYRDKIVEPSTSNYVSTLNKYKHIEKYGQNNINKRSDKECSNEKITPSTPNYIITADKNKYTKYQQNKNETGSDKQYRDKIMTPSTSKYIPTPNKYKLIKQDQNTNKSKKDVPNRTSNKCNNSSCCKTEKSGDKIKSRQHIPSSNHKIVKNPQQTDKEIMQRKNATVCIKSKVIKKHTPIRNKDATSYLYDKETIKYKEFYTNYKIPKISEKNKNSKKTEKAEIIENNNSTNLRSTKDIFCKEVGESNCSVPVESFEVVDDPEQKLDTTFDLRSKLADHSEQKLDTTFDLRSKLSGRSLNHYFTKLRNLSETTDNAQREQRDSLVITVPNDKDDRLKATGKRKLEDIKTSKKEEAKSTSPKFKKIELVINVICEKSATSSSDTDDEELLESRYTEQKNVISNLDLSFLDDFNIDEIVESCSKVNAANDYSLNDNTDEINNNTTDEKMLPVCLTDTKNERSRFMDSNIVHTNDILDKTENINSDKNEKQDITQYVGIIECDKNKIFEINKMSHKNCIEDKLNSQESLVINISNKRPEVLGESKINKTEGVKKFQETNGNPQIMNIVATECDLKKYTEMNEILHKEAEDEKDVIEELKRDVLETSNEIYFSRLPAKLIQEVRKEDITEHKQQSKTDNTPFIETTELKSESETENTSQADNEFITKTTEHQPETLNTSQASITFEINKMSHKNCIEDKLNSQESLVISISNKKPEVLGESKINKTEGIINFQETNGNPQIINILATECDLKKYTEMNEILHKAEDEKYVLEELKRDVLETNNEIYLSKLPAKIIQEVRKDDITEHKQQSKTNNTPFIETTEHKSESETENTCQADNESITKTTEHRPETLNTSQASITNKKTALSEDQSKKGSDITVDLQETDVYVAKKLEYRMKQYLNKKHTLTSLLHKGEFSKIYKCVNESGDKYALKVLNGEKKYANATKDYFIIKGLQRDVPRENYHCVYLFNGFGFTKHWCILMELYPKNLKQALQENRKPFHINVVQNLSRQLVSAVTLLRHNNIVHTNIKPTHILVNSANDQLKLCGFDEAQYKNDIQFSRNIGPMNYRAPEIILGHSAGFNMDVWSTALVMYEMATNIQLFPGIFYNDILYKQMFVSGPIPYEMIQESKYKSDHFRGMTFMREVKGGKCIPVPYRKIHKHDLVKKYVFLTYKNDWHSIMTYKQKQLDYAKLQSFCELLSKMLVIDPLQRLPIEFVYADPFIFYISD